MAIVTPDCFCPGCNMKIDRATGITCEQPNPGDITICLNCGHIMAFKKDLTIRDLTDEEMHDVAGDPRVIAIQKARAEVFRKN